MGEKKISRRWTNKEDTRVKLIKEKMKVAWAEQKAYANKYWCEQIFKVEDQVLLKFSPIKGAMWFNKKGKLKTKNVGLFEILESEMQHVD